MPCESKHAHAPRLSCLGLGLDLGAMSRHGMHACLFFACARCCFRRGQLLVWAIAINAIRRPLNAERAASALRAHMPSALCEFDLEEVPQKCRARGACTALKMAKRGNNDDK